MSSEENDGKVVQPDSGKQDMPSPIRSPSSNFQLLTLRAAAQSAKICRQDMLCDPVNYYIGMWGKVLILASTKRQAARQLLDPERAMKELNWDTIFREVFDRTPSGIKKVLSANNCLLWYEIRIQKFKEHFPLYDRYCSAIDQLVRHYSQQMSALAELKLPYATKLYWDNLHDASSVDSDTGCTTFGGSSVFSQPYLYVKNKNLCLVPTSFSSFVRRDQYSRSRTSASASSSGSRSTVSSQETSLPGSQETQQTKPKALCNTSGKYILKRCWNNNIKSSKQLSQIKDTISNEPSISVKIVAPNVEGVENYHICGHQHHHVVIDHDNECLAEETTFDFSELEKENCNNQQSQEKSLKRQLEPDKDQPIQKRMKLEHCHYELQPSDIADTKVKLKTEAGLHATLKKFLTGGLLIKMSWIIANALPRLRNGKNVNGSWNCPYLLPTIINQINKSEITDERSLAYACRCLIGVYIALSGKKTVSDDIILLQAILKSYSEVNS